MVDLWWIYGGFMVDLRWIYGAYIWCSVSKAKEVNAICTIPKSSPCLSVGFQHISTIPSHGRFNIGVTTWLSYHIMPQFDTKYQIIKVIPSSLGVMLLV
jgi:hypothetical protein